MDKWDSYERTFIKCGAKHFFINLRQIRETSTVQKFFSENKKMITIDLLYDPKRKEYTVKKSIFKNNLIDKFDSIIFIETTTASRH